MKRYLTIMIDTGCEPARIEIESRGNSGKKEEVIVDMAHLCEGVCTLIHSADQAGIKDSASLLRDCIKHLENGFSDPSYNTTITPIKDD